MVLDKFIEQTGLSPVTIWRFRKKKFLQTVNICGRHYVLRSEIRRFNSRALAGEFSKPCARPSIKSAKRIVDEEPTADKDKRAGNPVDGKYLASRVRDLSFVDVTRCSLSCAGNGEQPDKTFQ
jgi:hypothetical protein